MKTENTLDKKAKFFALYYGQVVLSHNSWLDNKAYKLLTPDNCEDWILQLKPLESISNEDAIKIAEIFRWVSYTNESKIAQVKTFLSQYLDYHNSNISSHENFNLIDYLRSKGYALPLMDLSVQDLIDYGWIKLVE